MPVQHASSYTLRSRVVGVHQTPALYSPHKVLYAPDQQNPIYRWNIEISYLYMFTMEDLTKKILVAEVFTLETALCEREL